MAKHKSSKQSSSYCPIVSDLIDLGAALALDVFSALLRQRESASKHSYRVDPYAAAGIAAGMGRLNTLDEARWGPSMRPPVRPRCCPSTAGCGATAMPGAFPARMAPPTASTPRTMRPAANMMPPFSRQSSSKPSFILPSWA